MAYLTSAAALTAARLVMEHYEFTVRPPETLTSGRMDNIQATEKCIAILIDYATNIFKVAELRPEFYYWQENLFTDPKPGQIIGFMDRLIAAFEFLPRDDEEQIAVILKAPPQFGMSPERHVLSKLSREASRFLFHYYTLFPKKEVDEKFQRIDETFHRINVAKLIDVCLEVKRLREAVPLLTLWRDRLRQGSATINDIKRCFRQVGIYLTYLPSYMEAGEEMKLL